MTQNPISSRLIDPHLFGTWIAERRHIWQMNFLGPDELATFCQRRALSTFDKKGIFQLWQLSLLQADVIVSDQELQQDGLVEHGVDEYDQHIYSDQRQLRQHPRHWEDLITETQPLLPHVSLLFHPFRYYVLYQIERMPFPIKSFGGLDFTSLKQRYDSEIFVQEVETWNDSASLIILTEPCAYRRIFHSYVIHSPYMGNTGLELLLDHINKHWEDVARCYQGIDIDTFKELHQDLCKATQSLDPNEDVHTLLCLGKSEMRLKLEGHLGGAIFLRTMAEFLRRAIQEVFNEELPEEDERGYGEMPKDAKKQLYGSNRLLEGNRKVANEFLRQHGLDYSLRLRWYVEGSTEFYALRSYFEKVGANDIEVIDLQGQIYQKNPRGLAFSASLRSDKELQLFSFISIDEGEARNEQENIRVVRSAAARHEMVGAFFLSKPDFEFANFELDELEEVVWQMAKSESPTPEERHILHEQVKQSKNSTDFFKGVKRAAQDLPQLMQISKGKAWGEHLMGLALEHSFKQGRKRQVIEAKDYAFYLIRLPSLESYEFIKENYQIDVSTGRPVELKSQ